MHALLKNFENNIFQIRNVKPTDIDDFIQMGVALFDDYTHATYAKSLLEAYEPPLWKTSYLRHGYLLNDDFPYFCAHSNERFNTEWIRLMYSEARVQLQKAALPAVKAVFNVDSKSPPPTPWSIIYSLTEEEFFVVDRAGHVVGAASKERLVNSAKLTFEPELIEASTGVHLELIKAV